jgi:uncharacterized protein (DUF1499 family)
MLPLNWKGNLAESLQLIKKVVATFPRTQLLKEEENYLHFTFKSALFGFIDDVEFYLDPQTKQVHFRSASRTGYSDLGANRKRMEQVVERYLKSSP